MDSSKLFKPQYHLYTTSDEFFLQKNDSEYTVVMNRTNNLIANQPHHVSLKGSCEETWGVLGIAHFPASYYLITIASCNFVGRIKDCCIFQVTSLEFIPFQSPESLAESPLVSKDSQLIQMFNTLISTESFYFSHDYELTHSIHRQNKLTEEQKSLHMWERSDYNYFWNNYLVEDFMQAGAHDAIIPVINGYVQIESVKVGIHFDYGIISRKDHRRPGTRFNTRGLDEAGHVVNFVETEQVLCYWEESKYVIHSFVQLRGSIPLIWEQKPNLKYAPKPKVLGDPSKNANAARLHLIELRERYEEVYLVNLIDKKGSQNMMGKTFSELFAVVKDLKLSYVWFDFHHECRGLKYENLSKLVDVLNGSLENFGWTTAEVHEKHSFLEMKPLKSQKGVVRTNCMDCLDRTNVVQSVIARRILLQHLSDLQLVQGVTGHPFQPLPEELEHCFRNFWVNNADMLSLLYSGTPAQKTDYTLTGKRTIKGALTDLKYSAQRYVINNFLDGYTQNAYDAFLGKYSARKLEDNFTGKYRSLITFLVLLLVGVLACYFVSNNATNWFSGVLVFGISLGLMFKLLSLYGQNLVSRPIIRN